MSTEKKKLTIKEFKMWLQGVEEMQDENWIPTATQWKRIREKIDDINDQAPAAPAQPAPVMYAPPAPTYATPAGPTVLAPGGMGNPAGATAPSFAPAPPPAGVPLASGSEQIPVKTPNIDTTNGQYRSAFA